MNILAKIQIIDRRILYLLIALVIILPLELRPKQHPKAIFKEVTNTYKTIDSVPKDKVVLLSNVWGPGTLAENGPQMEVLVRHMFQRGIKFVIISWDQEGAVWTYNIPNQLQKEYHKSYGKDWVHVGYRPPPIYIVASGMAKNFQQSLGGHDRFNKKLSDLPVTKNIKDYKQIGAVIEITPSATLGSWIAYFTQPHKIPLIYCPTAVMAPDAYPFLDSGQIKGMLNGVIGAAQYETLIGRGDVATDAAATAWALSAAHIYILLLIFLGNLGYLLSKRAARRNQGGTHVG